MNSKCSVIICNKQFILSKISDAKIHIISISLLIRRVDNKITKSIEYVVVSVYFKNKYNDKSTIVEVNIKIHLIDDLKIRLFIDVNIIDSENITLNFSENRLTIESC